MERLRALDALQYRFEGSANVAYQGPAPDEPAAFQYVVDFARAYEEDRAALTIGFSAGPSAFESTRHLDLTRTSGADEAARRARLVPHAVLRAFLDAPASVTLISRGPAEDVIAGVVGPNLVRVHIDARTQLVKATSWPIDDLRHGDSIAQAVFGDYSELDGWLVPGRFRYQEADITVFDLAYEIYAFGAEPMPSPAPETEGGAPSPGRGSPPGESEVFGEGVVALYDVAGPDYHALGVATPSGVVLIEAAGSIRDGLALTQRAQNVLGGPVVLVGATHHHGDHSGGFAGAVAHGASGLVAQGHAEFFTDMATALRSFAPVSFEPREEIDLIAVPAGGSHDVAERIVAYDVGNSHSREHLIFFVPDAGVLFQSDMAVFLWDGSVEPARDQACRLLSFIEEARLPVNTIVGGHGRPGTLEDLREAVRLRDTPCP